MDIKTVCLCDECSVGVSNDDWTSIDYHFGVDTEESNNEHARIMSMLELLGWMAYVGDADRPGYFNCDVCWGIQCGGGHTFEASKEA